MRKRPALAARIAACLAMSVVMGCGGTLDTTGDATMDTGVEPDVPFDDGVDTIVDVPVDTGIDSPADTGVDTGMDTGADTEEDTAIDTGVDTGVDPGVDEDIPDTCLLVVIEAETLAVNDYWAVCPGPDCEDDRSGSASGAGHLITYEGRYTAGAEGWISAMVALPRPGTWYLWAKSVRTGSGREWSAAVNGVDLPAEFGGGTTPAWEGGLSFDGSASSAYVTVKDANPDSWWAYPDAIILAYSPSFDPSTCGGTEASWCLCD